MNKRDIKAALKKMGVEFDKVYTIDEFKEMMNFNDEEMLASGEFGINRNTLWRLRSDPGYPKGRASPAYIIELDGKYSLHAIIHKDFGG